METHEKVFKTKYLALLAVLAFALVAALSLSACSDDSSDTSTDAGDYADLDPVTLILADSTAADSAGNQWGIAISEYASEITGGQLTVDYYGTGELGGDADLLRQAQSNDIQMVITQPSVQVSFIPDCAVFDLPMAFAGYTGDQIETVLNGDNEFSQGMSEAFNEAGFELLAWLQNGTYRVTTSNVALYDLEDFQGLQIRTMEDTYQMAFWEALGAEPTPLAFSEVYFALQNGTVDAQENAVDTIIGSSFQEVQDYIAMTDHMLYANSISINKDAWDALDPLYQDALMEAIQMATDDIRPSLLDIEESALETVTDAGTEVIEYDESFFEEVIALDSVQAVYETIATDTDGLSTLLIEELEAAASS